MIPIDRGEDRLRRLQKADEYKRMLQDQQQLNFQLSQKQGQVAASFGQADFHEQRFQQPYQETHTTMSYNFLIDDPNPNADYNPHKPYMKPRNHDPRTVVAPPFPSATAPYSDPSPPRGRQFQPQPPIEAPTMSSRSPPSKSPPRRLFSHTHDSPEEWERYLEKKRQQEWNKNVLEEQIRERRERLSAEARDRDELDSAEQRKYQPAPSPAAALSGAKSPKKKKNLSHLESSVFGDDAPEAESYPYPHSHPKDDNVTLTPSRKLHSASVPSSLASSHSSSLSSPPRVVNSTVIASPTLSPTYASAPPSSLLSEDNFRELEALRQVAVSQARELQFVKARLSGLEEGKNMFAILAAETAPKKTKQTLEHSLASLSPSQSLALGRSPLRESFGRSPPFRPSLPSEEDDCLPFDSTLIPADPVSDRDSGAGAAFGGYAVPTASMMTSNFGLTSFEKTFNPAKFEGRRDDALESFLTAFQNR